MRRFEVGDLVQYKENKHAIYIVMAITPKIVAWVTKPPSRQVRLKLATLPLLRELPDTYNTSWFKHYKPREIKK
jgi:hypothetical protein